MKHNVFNNYLVIQKKLGLYVAESHYFDVKGTRQITLTDKIEFAENMTLVEANTLISSVKNSKDYEVIENTSEYEEEEEILDEED